MINYTFDEFDRDIKVLAKTVRDDFYPDAIVAIARGGMTIGHSLAVALNNRNCFTLNSIHYDDTQKLDNIEIFNIPDLSKFRKILLVDDIIDSGETMVEILRILKEKFPEAKFKVATIFYKPRALMIPDYKVCKASEWVEFFWDQKID